MVLQNERLIKREVRKYLPRSRRDEFDTMYSDVVLARAHAIMRRWRADGGASKLTFLVKNCKWYAFEWCLGRKYKKVPEPVDLQQETDHVPMTLRRREAPSEVTAELSHVMAQLPEEQRCLLEWRFVKGYDLQEIASHLSVTKKTAQEMINVALFLVRMELGDDHADGA